MLTPAHPRRSASPRCPAPALAAAAAAVGALLAAPAAAQIGDRQLLATGGGDPYVMIMLDTSGSMAWGTLCTAEDRAADLCDHECDSLDCPVALHADDPESKLYQAKEALYEVMLDTTGVRWGFATMNQDELAVGAKHWLYRVTAVEDALAEGVSDLPDIPAVGWEEVFGDQAGGSGDTLFDMTCDRNGGGDDNNAELYETGCYMTSQDAPDIDTDDFWSLEKIRRLPKGGSEGGLTTQYFMREPGGNGDYYRFTYGPPSGECTAGLPSMIGDSCYEDTDCDSAPGTLDGVCSFAYADLDTFTVVVTIESCASNDVDAAATGCSPAWTTLGERTVTYSRTVLYDDDDEDTVEDDLYPRLGQFVWWEGTASKDTSNNTERSEDAYFGGRADGEPELPGVGAYASGVFAEKTCRGWEPSSDDWGQRDPLAVPSETDSFTEASTSYNLKYTTTHVTFDPDGTEQDSLFYFGDLIPLDWNNDNLTEVLTRLNPKHPTVDTESFAQAPFFADTYQDADTNGVPDEHFLRLLTNDDSATTDTDEAVRPLVAHGSSPLAGWFSMFRNWYSGCGDPGQCSDEFTGWQDVAAQYDANFACSKKYVLMLTDGDETCDAASAGQLGSEAYYENNLSEFPDGFSRSADQCRYRASLSAQEDVKSLVIGFGSEENDPKLQCADTPVYFASNAGELKDLLEELIGEIQEESAAFASAAVPTVQANILDKVYLSSFIPLNDTAVWPGRVDAFLKPLPLDDDNLPDRSDDVRCSDPDRLAACFAWDAGDSQLAWNGDADYDPEGLLLQAPFESEISDYAGGDFDDSSLKIGDGEDERRVYFGLPSTTTAINRRQLFDFPADPLDEADATDADVSDTENDEDQELANYEYAWNFDPTGLDVQERREQVADVIAFTLKEKQAELDQACTAGAADMIGRSCTDDADCDSTSGAGDGVCEVDVRIQYLMGDVFHSNPLVLNPPAEFEYFTEDLYWPGDSDLSDEPGTGLCGESAEDTALRGPQISYAWYSNKNLCRRVALFVGSNDGQVHAFDAGIFDGEQCQLNFASTAGDDELDQVAGQDTTIGDYDFGTGRELFAFIPESMMPVVEELSELDELTTQWGPDGTPLAADVFVDPYVGPSDSPDCEDRVWRTLVLQNYRSGGPGILALDVTQPDVFDEANNLPLPASGTLDYVPSCAANFDNSGSPTVAGCDLFCRQQSGEEDADCARLGYPALRWEFRDLDATGVPNDEDLNSQDDFAESWSRPFVARLPVCDGACDALDEPEDRFVAIFGGGVAENPANDSGDATGNWLYMVDMETGEPIYKRGGTGTSSAIVGAVPADITGVDFDTDGYVDTLYFGTTAGFVYKVDLELGPTEQGFQLDADGQITDVDAAGAADSGRFDPFQLFSTDGRPIYLEIGAVFVPQLRANAILFGTGDRSNLWEEDGVAGRFYAIVDTDLEDANRDGVVDTDSDYCTACSGLLTEANFTAVDPDTGSIADYLYGIGDAGPGWYFTLGENEKVITEAFTLTGITFFTVYDPLISEVEDVCAFSGDSKIFVVNTVTTEGYAIQAGADERTRYFTAPTFTTQPYVEYSATKNPGAEEYTEDTADSWTDELSEINHELRRLFPSGAKFANYTLDIKTVRSDTGIVFIAPVPVALEPHNWKEF
jgi:hypothetical protein